MSLKQRLNEDIKTAMRAGDKARLTTLRMATAAIKQREVDERIELDDSAVLAVVEKMIKQRRDAATQYEQGNRPELAAAEHAEIDILQDYLPEPLSEADLDALITAAMAEAGATSLADMGKVMATLKPAVQGRADMSQVSARVRALLGA